MLKNKNLEVVSESLELIGEIDKIIKPDVNVLLKVNVIVGFPPEWVATTHPSVVSAMVEAGGIPRVRDSSEAHGYMEQSLRISDIKKVSEKQ